MNNLKIIFQGLFLLCSFGVVAQQTAAPQISVTESETIYLDVDEVHFTVTINEYADEITDARNKNKIIAKEVIDFLVKEKVPKQYIQSRRINVSRHYVRSGNTNVHDGFKADQSIYVCLKDIENFDYIMDELLTMNVSAIVGPNFKSSQLKETQEKAKLIAIKKARESAKELAGALGQSIGPAIFITTKVNNNAQRGVYDTAPTTKSISSTNSFAPGELQVIVSVNASFELLP